ncbi:8868_t:CDS:2, partial [Entrophospora sp. SA101]
HTLLNYVRYSGNHVVLWQSFTLMVNVNVEPNPEVEEEKVEMMVISDKEALNSIV